MVRHSLKNVAIISAAIGAVVMSSPATAAPMSLRVFAEQQMRVATIGYRLNTANANSCRQPQMLTGMLLHDLSQYDPAVRASVSRAFSLWSGFGIIQIVPGSAADRAGVHIDDEVLAVGGISVEDPTAVTRSGKSYRRMERFAGILQSALQHGATEMLVRRNGAIIRITL